MGDRQPFVLVVDDNPEMARSIADGLGDRGFEAAAVSSGAEAARRLQAGPVDAMVTDLRMPDLDGLQLLALSRKLDPDRPVVIMTAYSAIDSAMESVRQGAYHYLTKPFKQDELEIFLRRALAEVRLRREAAALRRAARVRFSAAAIVGHSPATEALRARVQQVAAATAPVLLQGETGSGKTLVARALHAEGPRADGPFVSMHCGALPESLLDGELFGAVSEAGGARAGRPGLFVNADGGTLFLDEIGELSPALQAKLLRFLETGAVRAAGGAADLPADVRLVTATQTSLAQLVREGRFGAELLRRLDVVTIAVPSLRDRLDDIPALLEHLLPQARERHPRSPVRAFGRAALEALGRHGWPGNVRELAHVVERAVLLGREAEVGVHDLPEPVRGGASPLTFHGTIIPMRELERRYAAWVLAQSGGQRGRAAEQLGVDPKTLRKWLGDLDSGDGDLLLAASSKRSG